MNRSLLDLICCPACKGELQTTLADPGIPIIQDSTLECLSCSEKYAIKNGLPILIKANLQSASEQDWLGRQDTARRTIRADRVWYLISNLAGALVLPLLMVFAWSIDLWLLLRRSEIPFSIADVRGLFWWHLRHRRPYQHLRMLEHAMALNLIRSWRGSGNDSPVILDIGAEKSLFCSYLAHLGYRAIGLDLDQEQMRWQLARSNQGNSQRAGKLDFVVGSATELPFKDGVLNATAISVIEHIEDDRRAFSEIGRVIGTGHRAIVSFLYQDLPLSAGQKESAWKRAREHHPAYGTPRDPENHILEPSRGRIGREILFWKKLNRRAKRLVRFTRLFEHSMLFDYFVYVRLTRIEEALYPGKQANVFAGRTHAFQWIFELRRDPEQLDS